jgi:hypothetical protein
MIEERFPDSERQLLVVWATRALVAIQHYSEMDDVAEECRSILRKLTGTDTVLVARRAYPSMASSRAGDT